MSDQNLIACKCVMTSLIFDGKRPFKEGKLFGCFGGVFHQQSGPLATGAGSKETLLMRLSALSDLSAFFIVDISRRRGKLQQTPAPQNISNAQPILTSHTHQQDRAKRTNSPVAHPSSTSNSPMTMTKSKNISRCSVKQTSDPINTRSTAKPTGNQEKSQWKSNCNGCQKRKKGCCRRQVDAS